MRPLLSFVCERALEERHTNNLPERINVQGVVFQNKFRSLFLIENQKTRKRKRTNMDEFTLSKPFVVFSGFADQVFGAGALASSGAHGCARGLSTWCDGTKGAVGVCQHCALATWSCLFVCLSVCWLVICFLNCLGSFWGHFQK